MHALGRGAHPIFKGRMPLCNTEYNPQSSMHNVPSISFSPVWSMMLLFFKALLDVFGRMVALLVRKLTAARWGDRVRRQPSEGSPTVLKKKILDEVEPVLFEDVDCQFPPSSARYVSSAGWLFAPHQAAYCTPRPAADLFAKQIEIKSATSIFPARRSPRTFQSLPTEIHFQIAT